MGRKNGWIVVLVKRALGVLEEGGVELVTGAEVEGERFGVVKVGASVLDTLHVLDRLGRRLVNLMVLGHGDGKRQAGGGVRDVVLIWDVWMGWVRLGVGLLQQT